MTHTPEAADCTPGSTLGDGSDLRVLVITKGATSVIAEIKPISGNFTRVLDGGSELSLTGVMSAGAGDSCCEGWEDIYTWATEILVYRDGRDAWCGPVTDATFEYGSVSIQADDVTAWLDRRPIPNLQLTNMDLSDIAVAIIEASMEEDPSPNIIIDVAPTGVVGSRSYVGNTYQYAGDALDELAKTGLDYTVYGRTVIIHGEELEVAPYVTLMDEHWTTPPKVRQRGNEQCTVAVVKGKGIQATATAEPEYLDFYGRLVRTFDEPNIEDETTLALAAQTRVDLLKDAVFIETPVGAGLKVTAPITLQELIPGIRVRVDTHAGCRKIVADFRLQKVTVDFNGTVSIDLEPLGHTVGDEPTEIVVT